MTLLFVALAEHVSFFDDNHAKHLHIIYICLKSVFVTAPTKGDGRLCFCRRQYIGRHVYIYTGRRVYIYTGRYVYEQQPGASSSPIVTKLCQSYPWPQGTR